MATIRIRRDTSVNWLRFNPVLANGEPGFAWDIKQLKIGDGAARWADLPYFMPDIPDTNISDEQLLAHINSLTPHPAYDDGPSLLLLYQNAKV